MLARLSWSALAVWCIQLLAADTLRAEPNQAVKRGRLQLLTYNVAGLPEGVSESHPVANLPQIGKLLGSYDLALIQEDFAYPELLRQQLRLPYGSRAFHRGEALHFGDGLSFFGKLPFAEPTRAAWRACNGVVDAFFDCLTPKGLAMVRVEVSPNVSIDVYDVHLDAGGTEKDRQARAVQLPQLMETIQSWSGERAVIVGGDFNLGEAERSRLFELGGKLGLSDACSTLRCADPGRIDRVLYRGSAALTLRARSWRLDHGFRDKQGRPLSDHAAVAVAFDWATR
jgi:endonuclease/exonuclease/phosphatase family metal-dependent hydrolase